MVIPKLAEDVHRLRRAIALFPSARSAFKAILQEVAPRGDRVVLLPAYIGWSDREGSGVFDPIRELGLPFAFYRVSRSLEIDVADLEVKIRRHPRAALLVIHYFGRVDPSYDQVVELARTSGAELIEDEAHALLTDLIGGRSGRGGAHAFFSLHKLLPLSGGGAWVRNGQPSEDGRAARVLLSFDLASIANVRRANHEKLTQLLQPLQDRVRPLWPVLASHEVPQTYPVILDSRGLGREFRDRVYARLNERGFGVVSLYHTLVEAIPPDEFQDSFELSRRILNLPVHQDVATSRIYDMVAELATVLSE